MQGHFFRESLWYEEYQLVNKDNLYDKLFEDNNSDADLEVLCIQALELICCATLLILERQCKDQLPVGRYLNPSKETSEMFKNVPATNMVVEISLNYISSYERCILQGRQLLKL